MNDLSISVSDESQIHRVYGEFLEMPGLQLTCKQAQRLFGLSERACAAVLDALVTHKFLERRPDGVFSRVTDGYAALGSVLHARPGDELERTK